MEPAKAQKLASPQERLDLVVLGLGRRTPVTELCAQAGVSRELFYRWTRAVREAGLRALEAKAPGPKRIPEQKAPERALRLAGRVERLEKDLKGLRKDRDHWRLVAEVARRIIRRQGWGPAPGAGSKKKPMRGLKPGDATSGSGPRSAPAAPLAGSSPSAGECTGAPTGGGSPASCVGPGQGSCG